MQYYDWWFSPNHNKEEHDFAKNALLPFFAHQHSQLNLQKYLEQKDRVVNCTVLQVGSIFDKGYLSESPIFVYLVIYFFNHSGEFLTRKNHQINKNA